MPTFAVSSEAFNALQTLAIRLHLDRCAESALTIVAFRPPFGEVL